MKSRALFLDRDGVVNQMYYDQEHGIFDSPLNPNQFFLNSGIEKLIKIAKNAGFNIIIISNQPVIAKGKTTLKLLKEITAKMLNELSKKDAEIDEVIYCLHHPQAKNQKYRKNCSCRKPKPGMILIAAKKFNLDLKQSIVIGDGIVDVQAGVAAGCRTVLFTNDKIDLRNILNKFRVKPDLITNKVDSIINFLN